MKTTVLILAAAAALAACTPTPQTTEPTEAQAVVDAMTYVKSKVGICYGVTTVTRISSSMTLAVNQMIVAVDCSKVGL